MGVVGVVGVVAEVCGEMAELVSATTNCGDSAARVLMGKK